MLCFCQYFYDNFSIQANPNFTHYVACVAVVDNSIQFTDLQLIASTACELSFPVATLVIQDLQLALSSVKILSMPVLTFVGGSFDAEMNINLETLNLPSLTYIGTHLKICSNSPKIVIPTNVQSAAYNDKDASNAGVNVNCQIGTDNCPLPSLCPMRP